MYKCMQTFSKNRDKSAANMSTAGALSSFTTCHSGGRARLVASDKRLYFYDQCAIGVDHVSDDLPITCAVYNPVRCVWCVVCCVWMSQFICCIFNIAWGFMFY